VIVKVDVLAFGWRKTHREGASSIKQAVVGQEEFAPGKIETCPSGQPEPPLHCQ